MATTTRQTGNGTHGMNWIRQQKRLAIYLRDGAACIYCGEGVEDGATLTLDHVTCRNHGGGNGAENLVTACRRCNSSRGDRPVEEFAAGVAAYINHGVTAERILDDIATTTARPLPMDEARTLIERRGSAAKALAHVR